MDTSLFGEKVLSLGKRSEQTGTIVETAEMAQALARVVAQFKLT